MMPSQWSRIAASGPDRQRHIYVTTRPSLTARTASRSSNEDKSTWLPGDIESTSNDFLRWSPLSEREGQLIFFTANQPQGVRGVGGANDNRVVVLNDFGLISGENNSLWQQTLSQRHLFIWDSYLENERLWVARHGGFQTICYYKYVSKTLHKREMLLCHYYWLNIFHQFSMNDGRSKHFESHKICCRALLVRTFPPTAEGSYRNKYNVL